MKFGARCQRFEAVSFAWATIATVRSTGRSSSASMGSPGVWPVGALLHTRLTTIALTARFD